MRFLLRINVRTIGIGDRVWRGTLTKLGFFDQLKITDTACGNKFSLICDVNGNVYGCGSLEYGQIGLNPSIFTQIKQNIQKEKEQKRLAKIEARRVALSKMGIVSAPLPFSISGVIEHASIPYVL